MPSRKTLGRTFRARPTSTTCAGIQKLPYHCWLEARFHPAHFRRELLLHDLPASIRLTAGPTVGLLVTNLTSLRAMRICSNRSFTRRMLSETNEKRGLSKMASCTQRLLKKTAEQHAKVREYLTPFA